MATEDYQKKKQVLYLSGIYTYVTQYKYNDPIQWRTDL